MLTGFQESARAEQSSHQEEEEDEEENGGKLGILPLHAEKKELVVEGLGEEGVGQDDGEDEQVGQQVLQQNTHCYFQTLHFDGSGVFV